MDQFRQKAIEEAHELISDLESSLLVLEDNANDKNHISKVFRIMHTLKGNSAMFGFDFIAEYTHHIESIYDLVRNDKLKLNKDIFDLTLGSVDHLKLLLEDINLTDEANKNAHTQNLNKILGFVKKINALIESGVEFIDLDAGKEAPKPAPEIEPTKTPEPLKEEPKTQPIEEVKTETEEKINSYLINFNPHKELLQMGTNPLFLFDDLLQLGTIKSYIIPHYTETRFDDFNPIHCFVNWKIIVTSKHSIDDIKDVFIFVESDCELDIKKIADDNILTRKTADDDIKKVLEYNNIYSLTSISHTFDSQSSETKKEVKAESPIPVIEKTETKSESEPAKPVIEKPVTATTVASPKESAVATSIRVPSERLDTLMNLVSELVTTQARLSMFAENSDNTEITSIAENVQKLTRQLRDIAFNICLVPIQNLLTRFQRLVRDLSSELKKDVEFLIEGSETELDKSMIESLSDPIMHILRNSLDHGIELPDVRIAQGKNRKATILIRAYYSGANVIIQISDDGAGIDIEKVRNKAISKGLISADAVLSKKEIIELIFQPGFSTAEKITGVSGRGVGMDVVRRKIMDIRGEVDIDTKPGQGTTITIRLPLTLSIIDGLLILIDDTSYILPLSVVDKCYAVEHEKIKTAYNNIVVLDGQQIPFYYMRQEFDCKNPAPEIEQIIIVRYEEHRIGIVIDTVVGEYQAVLKPLGKMYKDQDIVSGASILGDGTIALVLDSNKIIKRFGHQENN